ncbi:MAG: mechanosensitive ion channel [Candidatus Aenigmarchaeota archaeon]|nr:mechanosensitive ion channel [Candidatus Aenigmarchaeota archaeon]
MAIELPALIANEYLRALFIVIGAYLFAKVSYFVLNRYVKKITAKTKTDLDDKLLDIFQRYFTLIVTVAGLYFALNTLSATEPYQSYIDGAAVVLGVFVVATMASKMFSVIFIKFFKVQRGHEKTPRLITKIIAILVYVIAFLMVLSYFEVEITPLIATLGIGGLALGLALQPTLSNFFSGLYLVSDRPISVGEFIELPDSNLSGVVEDIGWRTTRIKTLSNQIVVVPNALISESVIINDTLSDPEMSVKVLVGVSYDSDLEKVEKVTLDVARKILKTVPGAIKDFEPKVRFKTFGESNIDFNVILRAEKMDDTYLITHEFIKALKKRYDKEKIEISWPVVKVYKGK